MVVRNKTLKKTFWLTHIVLEIGVWRVRPDGRYKLSSPLWTGTEGTAGPLGILVRLHGARASTSKVFQACRTPGSSLTRPESPGGPELTATATIIVQACEIKL